MRVRHAVLFGALGLALLSREGIAKNPAVRVALVACAEGKSERVPLRSTDRAPGASGAARLERKGGTTTIEVDVNSIEPASLFGGDYNTYVLWVVPPRGPAENGGELILDGDHANVVASTPSAEVGILVTAEPHFLVTKPSAFVVLTNEPPANSRIVEQPIIEGIYNFHRSTLDDVKEAKGEVHTEIRQAFTAVRLAQRVGAAALASEEFIKAQHALDETLKSWKNRNDRIEIAAQARETVRLAVIAQRLAEDRAFHATRVGTEGLGGGKGEVEGRDLRAAGLDRR
jgi:hypothetical protein